MKAVLVYRSQDGTESPVCAYGFKWVDFTGCQIVSGDKYYIDKAAKLGAEKPKKAKKSKPAK